MMIMIYEFTGNTVSYICITIYNTCDLRHIMMKENKNKKF